jgi:hypothetical protein
MINGELAVLDEGYDVVAAAENILQQESLNAMAAVAIDHAADYLSSLEAMNRNFTTLSADDAPEAGYSQDQLSALMSASLAMDTLSADTHVADSRHMAAVAQAESRDRFVRFLLDEDSTSSKED